LSVKEFFRLCLRHFIITLKYDGCLDDVRKVSAFNLSNERKRERERERESERARERESERKREKKET
jgi:hypothetical protein